MTDEEKRQRVETLLLALKDWCEESCEFLDKTHSALFDLLIDEDATPAYRRLHWVNNITKVSTAIRRLLPRVSGFIRNNRDPAIYESEVQRRANNQRKSTD